MVQEDVLITDTCSVYKLYFFSLNGVILSSEIHIPNLGTLKFHKVVIKEFYDDLETYKRAKKYSLQNLPYPSFFDSIQCEGLEKLKKFIQDNLLKNSEMDLEGEDF